MQTDRPNRAVQAFLDAHAYEAAVLMRRLHEMAARSHIELTFAETEALVALAIVESERATE